MLVISLANRLGVAAKLLDDVIEDLDALHIPVACVAQGGLIACLAGVRMAIQQIEGMAGAVDPPTPHERAEVDIVFAMVKQVSSLRARLEEAMHTPPPAREPEEERESLNFDLQEWNEPTARDDS